MACCEKNQDDFNGEKLDIIISGSGKDGHCRIHSLKDTSNTNLKFELTRIAPLVLHHRKEIGAHVMETFSMTDLRIQYLLMENNISSFFITTSTGSPAMMDCGQQYTLRSEKIQQPNFDGYTDISAGDGTVVAAKFAPSGPDHAEGGMSPQSWFALQQKLSSLLGVATGHLQRHAAVVSSAPPIGYVRPVRISRNRAVLLQQIPGHRLSAEAVDRWLDLATDMGFHIGAAFDGEGKSTGSLKKQSIAGLLHRSWLMSASWLSLALTVSSHTDKTSRLPILAYNLQIQASLISEGVETAREPVLQKLHSSRNRQRKILLRKLEVLISSKQSTTSESERDSASVKSAERVESIVGDEPIPQQRLSCPRILTANRVVLESRTSLYFQVEDRYSVTIPSSTGAQSVSAAVISVTETVPEFYDILLSKYTYLVVSTNEEIMSGDGVPEATVPVIDLPSFRYSAGDCLKTKRRPSSSPSSFFCERHITWSINLTSFLNRNSSADSIRLSLVTRFTAAKRFNKREFQPADASRGLLLPAAISHLSVYYHGSYQANAMMNVSSKASSFPLWCVASVVRQDQIQAMMLSNSALLTTPIPDLSMPYNVITLVSTFAAFFLGSIVNALYRRRASAGKVATC